MCTLFEFSRQQVVIIFVDLGLLVVIDQHAAHERVRLEKLLAGEFVIRLILSTVSFH